MFALQTRARAINLRIALTTMKKGNMSAADYFAKMKGFADDMAVAGRPLDDGELIEHILTGLNAEFESLVSALVTRVEPISVEELYSQLLTFKTRMDLMHGGDHGSANWAGRGGRTGRGAGHGGRGRGSSAPGRGRWNNNSNTNNYAYQGGSNSNRQYNNNKKPTCQVCFKKGHTATECWHHFEEDYVPDEKHVAAATSSHGDQIHTTVEIKSILLVEHA